MERGYCLGLEASSRVLSLNHCRMCDVGIWMRMHYWEKLEGVPAMAPAWRREQNTW